MKQEKQTYEQVYKAYEDYLLLKNYSAHTRSAYLSNFRLYHSWCVSNGEERIYNQDTVKKYLLDWVRQGAKWQTTLPIHKKGEYSRSRTIKIAVS